VTGNRADSLRAVFPVALVAAVALIVSWILGGWTAAHAYGQGGAPETLTIAVAEPAPAGGSDGVARRARVLVRLVPDARSARGTAQLSASAVRELFLPVDRVAPPWGRFTAAGGMLPENAAVLVGGELVLTVTGIIALAGTPAPGELVCSVAPADLARIPQAGRITVATSDGDTAGEPPASRTAAGPDARTIAATVMLVVAGLMGVCVAAIVGAAVGVAVAVRNAELRTVVSLGFTPSEIRRLIAWEGALLAGVGTLLGVAGAALLTVVLRERGIDLSLLGGLFDIGAAAPVRPPVTVVPAILALAVSLAAGWLAALPWARRAAIMAADSSVWRL